MRRLRDMWPEVTAFSNLLCAFGKAARGKRDTKNGAAFGFAREPELLRLQRELCGGDWRPAKAHEFVIHDPKRRAITAVPFVDRVVHHALIGPLEPWFDSHLDPDSFACRRGFGTHRALRRARQFVRRHRFVLKLDVQGFFASLRHDVVLTTLRRLIKDGAVLDLARTILAGPIGNATTGLPIGSLTSQWFANLTLGRLDRFVRERLRPRGYARYMDDFLLAHDDKPALHTAHDEITTFLEDELALRLKPSATMLRPTWCGLPFLGFVVFPNLVRVRPESLRRYRWRLRFLRWRLERGEVDAERFRQGVAAVFQHLSFAGTRRLRRGWLRHHDLEL